jgi:hypothetical protein
VQRLPDYLDPADEPQLRQSELKSATNKSYGRKLRIVSFRFLTRADV